MTPATTAILMALLGLVSSVQTNRCRDQHPVMENLDIEQLEGTWYEYARYPNLMHLLILKGNCNHVAITKENESTKLDYYWRNGTSFKGHILGYLQPEKAGYVKVQLPSVDVNNVFGLLKTEYDDFIVLYSCDTLWYFKIELVYVLTRQPTLSSERRSELLKKLAALKIDTDRLEFVEQVCGN